MFSIDEARTLLQATGVFFDLGEDQESSQCLNLSDTWGWACADGEDVPDEELPRLAELFWQYGNCGILFWVSERRDKCRSEFHDINRFIDFVRAEEAIRAEEPSSSKRAYLRREYSIGGSSEASAFERVVADTVGTTATSHHLAAPGCG